MRAQEKARFRMKSWNLSLYLEYGTCTQCYHGRCQSWWTWTKLQNSELAKPESQSIWFACQLVILEYLPVKLSRKSVLTVHLRMSALSFWHFLHVYCLKSSVYFSHLYHKSAIFAELPGDPVNCLPRDVNQFIIVKINVDFATGGISTPVCKSTVVRHDMSLLELR